MVEFEVLSNKRFHLTMPLVTALAGPGARQPTLQVKRTLYPLRNDMWQILLTIAAVAIVGGCDDNDVTTPGENWVEYQMSVENIEVPQSISASDTLEVKLYGVIGPDTSYKFDRMETAESDSVFEMTAYGLHDTSDGPALDVLIVWGGRAFKKVPPHASVVRVVYNQPDGSTIEEIVTVTQ